MGERGNSARKMRHNRQFCCLSAPLGVVGKRFGVGGCLYYYVCAADCEPSSCAVLLQLILTAVLSSEA
jgi:hypothetical protein